MAAKKNSRHPRKCTGHSKRSGELCEKWALKGKTKCAIHGGKSLAGPACPSYKHGLYSKYDSPEAKARGHIEAAKRLSAIQILEQTIPVAAGILSLWMETSLAFDTDNYAATTALIGRITKAVSSYEKLTNPEMRTGKLIVEHEYKNMSDQDLIDAIRETQEEAEAICRVATSGEE